LAIARNLLEEQVASTSGQRDVWLKPELRHTSILVALKQLAAGIFAIND